MRNWETFTRTTGIYRISNKKTNIRYIGSSKDIAGRWKSHLYQLRIKKHHCSYLQNSFNIHGFVDFSFEVVEVCKQEDLAYREWANWMVEDMIFGTFNSSPVNPILPGVIHTEETKEKISAAKKGEKNAMFGKKHSEETKEKMSQSQKGNKHSEETKERMSKAKNNMSAETKAKLSTAMKGKKKKPFTEEHKERMRLSWAKRKEKKKLAEEVV